MVGTLYHPGLPGSASIRIFVSVTFVGQRHQGWHHPGALYSNTVSRRHQLFDSRCGYSQIQSPFPVGCDRNIKNVGIAIKLSRVVIHVLTDVPPSVPNRGDPLVSALTSRKLRPNWERRRLERVRMKKMERDLRRFGEGDKSSEEGSVGGESSEEESVA